MEYHLGIEDIEPGNWVAWVFELPGCYARGNIREETLERVPEAIAELLNKLSQKGLPAYGAQPPFTAHIAEEFRAYNSSPDYLVNAFFRNDAIPPAGDDIVYARHVLGIYRDELMAIISIIPEGLLDRDIKGEVQKNIRGILNHIGTAEWWYWDRLGLAPPREERPEDIRELLSKTREFTLQHLPELVGNRDTTIRKGEEWSPRKLLRRTIWHERAHTLQIRRYMKSFNSY